MKKTYKTKQKVFIIHSEFKKLFFLTKKENIDQNYIGNGFKLAFHVNKNKMEDIHLDDKSRNNSNSKNDKERIDLQN